MSYTKEHMMNCTDPNCTFCHPEKETTVMSNNSKDKSGVGKEPQKLSNWKQYFKPPFKYAEESGAYILDSDGIIVAEVRGWGHLIHRLTDGESVVDVQEQMAIDIAALLNSESELSGLKEENERLIDTIRELQNQTCTEKKTRLRAKVFQLESRIKELEQQLHCKDDLVTGSSKEGDSDGHPWKTNTKGDS